jgi:hypothetical protein
MLELLVEEYECMKCVKAKNEKGLYTEEFVIWLIAKQDRIEKIHRKMRRRKDDNRTVEIDC